MGLGLRIKNFNTIGFTEKSIFFKKKKHIGGLPKKGGVFGQFADLRGRLVKTRGMIFWEGVDTPMQTIELPSSRVFIIASIRFNRACEAE